MIDEDKLDPSIPWIGMSARWRDVHLSQLAAALDQKLTMLAVQLDTGQISTVLHWLEALNEEDPVSALAVADRLDTLLSRVGAEGLGRWILTGLRMYPGQQLRQQAYFRLDDQRAIETLHGEAGAGALSASLPSLALLLHGLCGREIQLQPRRQSTLEGLPLRPVLTPTHLLLPDDYTALDGSDRYRLYRAAVAHAVAHLRYSTAGLPTLTLKPMGIAVVSAIEDARVERLLVRDYPGVQSWFVEFLRRGVKPEELGFAALVGRMNLALMDPEYQDDNFWVNKARRLFEAQAANLTDYPAFRRLASILANDLGQMRVPFRAQRYVVPEAYRDDNSFLWDFSEPNVPAPEPLDLQVKAPQRPDATALDDPLGQSTALEIELGRQSYPEWDAQLSLMRTDWCTVIEKRPAWQGQRAIAKRDAPTLPLVPLIRSRRLSRRQRLRRQWEGDDIDLNAAIEAVLDQRLSLSPDLRLFTRAGREEQASSILVLLDLSESTNDCPGASMESILDIEKKAALLLVQSVVLSGDRIAVHGFSSNTRAEVNYYRLLEFGAPLDADAAAMIRSVPGRYSTRMGAALRHAVACLAHEPFDHRAIVLVTDGAPSDIDVFKTGYLIEDARAAVHEGRRAGVQSFCVALDPQADPYVRRIFGWNNYRIVDEPNRLPTQLSTLYNRLAAS
ncbi:MAG: VWA domain-containing protein [Burkholderiaceae bacterium]|nr:VWA domain-containing protein [Burkholderiaceae bacterium]